MLKLVFLRLETQGDRTPHVRECCSQHGRRDHMLKKMALTGQAGTGTVSPIFFFIDKLLRGL
jgi:hypothetical protein